MLDNVVWHLVEREEGTLSEGASRKVALPTYQDEVKFKQWADRLRKVVPCLGDPASELHERVSSLQPFRDGSEIPSISIRLADVIGRVPDFVHPLVLIQEYSNADKHRSIRAAVALQLTHHADGTLAGLDSAGEPVSVGSRVAPDGQVGDWRELEMYPTVCLARPVPSKAIVAPAAELQRLTTWVREYAVPFLVTGTLAAEALPVRIDAEAIGHLDLTALAASAAVSGQARLDEYQAQVVRPAVARAPLSMPEIRYAEFED